MRFLALLAAALPAALAAGTVAQSDLEPFQTPAPQAKDPAYILHDAEHNYCYVQLNFGGCTTLTPSMAVWHPEKQRCLPNPDIDKNNIPRNATVCPKTEHAAMVWLYLEEIPDTKEVYVKALDKKVHGMPAGTLFFKNKKKGTVHRFHLDSGSDPKTSTSSADNQPNNPATGQPDNPATGQPTPNINPT
ncbi:hypothetical protein NUU61_007137 [Penicillium alfredii]|uniref:Uncharacterized protein n=1 Tax=Penicillium alfredii TaxID=1506179 RepID=A0A9W9K4X1_9EURO|nr:uncharacterized protein NUU61_007137 [Penicillium alfredii]KAJ5092267.1 hypothetical protein NUU61_007137 [Penicillium alfredii]